MSDRGDEFDRATAREMADREAAISRIRAAAKESHPDFNGVDCVECEESIAPERLAMQKVRCVFCQRKLEARRNQLGRT